MIHIESIQCPISELPFMLSVLAKEHMKTPGVVISSKVVECERLDGSKYFTGYIQVVDTLDYGKVVGFPINTHTLAEAIYS